MSQDPEPFLDSRNLLLLGEFFRRPQEPLSKSDFFSLRLFRPCILIEAISPSIAACHHNTVGKAGRTRWRALSIFLDNCPQGIERLGSVPLEVLNRLFSARQPV
jgi:hypothetical protein